MNTSAQQIVNLELQIRINIDKERVGTEEMLTAEYSNINWHGVQDTKEDVRKVVALGCKLEPGSVIVRESIPHATGLQCPRLVISFPRTLTEDEMHSVNNSIINYFELISNPEKELPSLFEEQFDFELKNQIRETARDFCARRNGRQLPCEIIITGASFSSPITCPTKVAKPKHPLILGNEYEVTGKADGYKLSKHRLEFLMEVKTTNKKGEDRVKYRDIKVGYDRNKYEEYVVNLPHGSETTFKLIVQDFVQGKKKWIGLKEIKAIQHNDRT